MGKKEEFFMTAQRLFVEEHLPLCRIAQKLDISERSLVNWKREGDWDKKRSEFLKAQYCCYTELYALLRKLTVKINSAVDAGEEVEQKLLTFTARLIDKIPKLKTYEQTEVAEHAENEAVSDEDIAVKIAQLVDKKLTGG